MAVFGLIIIITVLSINNSTILNVEKQNNLLSIEWTIFGITTAFFTIWNALYLSKHDRNTENPDKMVGIERLKAIQDINNKLSENNNLIFPIILLIINAFLLLWATSLTYVYPLNDSVLNKVSIISYYFCTNTMISIFFETITPMIKMKLEFEEKRENFNLNADNNLILKAIAEKIALIFANSEFADLPQTDCEKKISELTDNLVKIRENRTKNSSFENKTYYISNENKTLNVIKENSKFKTIDELYNLLENAGWTEEMVFMENQWNPSNKCSGQCNATSLLIKEYFGGEIIKYPKPSKDKKCHYFNRIDDVDIDLTYRQFSPRLKEYIKMSNVISSFGKYESKCEKAYKILKRNLDLE